MGRVVEVRSDLCFVQCVVEVEVSRSGPPEMIFRIDAPAFVVASPFTIVKAGRGCFEMSAAKVALDLHLRHELIVI